MQFSSRRFKARAVCLGFSGALPENLEVRKTSGENTIDSSDAKNFESSAASFVNPSKLFNFLAFFSFLPNTAKYCKILQNTVQSTAF